MTGKTPLLSRGNIIGLARQVADPDKEDPLHNDLITLTLPELERFVALVAERAAAAEREACARILDENSTHCTSGSPMNIVLRSNAAAIRARGAK